jgi:hypothetical protein
MPKLYFGPVNVDLEANAASVDLPGGGQVRVGPKGAEVSVPGTGRVSFGPGGGSVETADGGRIEVRSDGVVLLPDDTVWNSRGSGFPDVVSTPVPGGSVPIPYPNIGDGTIGIPFPKFVIERFDVPIHLPTISARTFEIPISMPRFEPAPFNLPQVPNWPSLGSWSTAPWFPPQMPDLLPTSEDPARHVPEIKRAIVAGIDAWRPTARVAGGTINGAIGVIPRGALSSVGDLKAAVRDRLMAEGVPAEPYGRITDGFANAWNEWFSGYSTTVQYPAFAYWPGNEAPPMPALAQPLLAGHSTAEPRVSVGELHLRAAQSIDWDRAEAELKDAVRQLALWFAMRFIAMKAMTMLVNVLGRGPVPLYAPPQVPAAPVMGGSILPSQAILVGPNPFQIP